MDHIENFEQSSIAKTVLSNAIPAIISMVVVLLYNVADTFFIGQTGDSLQVAAVSLATPVFLLFMAIGTLYGIGGTSVISRAFGKGDKGYAKRVSAFCFWMSVFTGIVFILILQIGMDPILDLIGTSANTRELARSYLIVVSWSAPFVLISTAFSNIVRAEGKSNEAMIGNIVGTAINIILDPIMIIGMKMGISGAAWATVIGNVIGTAYYIWILLNRPTLLSLSWKQFSFHKTICRDVFAIGVPASLQSIMMSVSSIILNVYLAGYGDLPLASYGIAVKISMVVGLLQIGLGQAIQPLLGYQYGAGNKARFKAILRFSNVTALIMGVALTAACWIFADPLTCLFIDSPEVQQLGIHYLKILIVSGPVLGIMFVYINALQAMGAASASLLLSISRQGIIFIPCMLLMNVILGMNGLIWAQPIADVCTTVISYLLYHFRRSWK